MRCRPHRRSHPRSPAGSAWPAVHRARPATPGRAAAVRSPPTARRWYPTDTAATSSNPDATWTADSTPDPAIFQHKRYGTMTPGTPGKNGRLDTDRSTRSPFSYPHPPQPPRSVQEQALSHTGTLGRTHGLFRPGFSRRQTLTQLVNVPALIPRSRATSATGLPVSTTICAASAFNYALNLRRCSGMHTSSQTRGPGSGRRAGLLVGSPAHRRGHSPRTGVKPGDLQLQ